jgi:hypothetical protein
MNYSQYDPLLIPVTVSYTWDKYLAYPLEVEYPNLWLNYYFWTYIMIYCSNVVYDTSAFITHTHTRHIIWLNDPMASSGHSPIMKNNVHIAQWFPTKNMVFSIMLNFQMPRFPKDDDVPDAPMATADSPAPWPLSWCFVQRQSFTAECEPTIL